MTSTFASNNSTVYSDDDSDGEEAGLSSFFGEAEEAPTRKKRSGDEVNENPQADLTADESLQAEAEAAAKAKKKRAKFEINGPKGLLGSNGLGEAEQGAKGRRSEGLEELSDDRILHNTINCSLLLVASLLAIPYPNAFRDLLRSSQLPSTVALMPSSRDAGTKLNIRVRSLPLSRNGAGLFSVACTGKICSCGLRPSEVKVRLGEEQGRKAGTKR